VNYAAVVATPSSDTLCSGETTNINLTTPATGSTFAWTVVQNGVSGASAGSGNTIAQTLTTTGSTQGTAIYTITPQNVGCTGTPVTVTIVVNPPIVFAQNTNVCINQLPYNWNGQTFTTGGTSIATYTTPSLVTGCDSTTILSLSINPVLTATVDKTICAGQLPYSWNGIPITAGGTAVATYTTNSTQFNCDSTTILNLSVVTTLTATTTVTICENDLPYLWNNISVTQGGPIAATFNTTSPTTGCDSITTLNLIVKPVPYVVDTVSVCQNQLPYTWNGTTVTAGGPTAATFTSPVSSNGCDSITVLYLIVNQPVTANQNITICANQLPLNWNGQIISSVGPGIISYTSTSLITGCDSTTILNLTVNPVSSATSTITICASQLPYTWNNVVLNAGGNSVASYVTNSAINGCDSTTILNLIVNPLLTAVKNITICSSQLPYTWNNIVLTAGGNNAATFTTASTVTSCDSTTILNLTVNPVLNSTANISICASQLPYTWNNQVITAGGNNVATFVTPSLVTSCDSAVTLNLTVNPAITATVNKTICASQLPYVWNNINVTAAGTGVATFNTISLITGCDSIVTLNLTANPQINVTQTLTICSSQLPYTWNGQTLNVGGSGITSFTTTSSTGCDSTTVLNLIVNPVITVVKNITICSSQLPYTWNNQILTAGGNAVATFTTSSTANNCDSTTTLNLTVNPVLTAVKNITICSSQLPYTWNGQTLTAGGTAVTTYTTASAVTGCDSTTTLNLTVNPVLTATKSMTKCANQMPFVWNGVTVTTAGPAAATFTTTSAVTGCDSTTTLNLTVNPVLTATKSMTKCANQMPFVWNGITVTTAGPAAATFTTTSAVTGCDSTTTLSLTVNPVLTAVANKTVCIGAMPYTWNGTTVTAGGIGVATYTTPSTVTGCDSTTTLNLTVNPNINVVKNISICINQLPYTWNGQTITAGGTAVASYTTTAIVGGCDSTTVLNLTVNPLLTAVKNLTICINQLPYVWNSITVTAAGNGVATFTSSSLVTGCDSTTTLNLTVNPVLMATQTLIVCSGQLPYNWNGVTVGVGGNGAATFTTASAVTGCDSTTTLNLNVVPALLGTQNVTICASQLPYLWNGVTVAAGGPAAATFNSVSASTGCDSITTLNLIVKPVYNQVFDTSICYAQIPFVWYGQSYAAAGNYTNTYSSALNCDSVVTLSLHVTTAPFTLQSRDTADCGYVSFRGNVYTANTTVIDTVHNYLGCDSTYQTFYVKVFHAFADTIKAEICAYQNYEWVGDQYNQSGLYSKHYTTARGCDSVVNLDLTVWNVSQVSITHNLDEAPCRDDTITVTGHGASAYLWKLNGVEQGNTEEIKMILSSKENIIVVNATDEHSCESVASVSIESVPCCDLMIPNAFSPNGDGLNDKYGPETIGNPKEFKMMIFNRYGQLMFTSVNVGVKWDGTYLGKPVDVGTYFFRIFSKCTNDAETNYKGDITLIR
jgi:gliding motility-associated-like protein